MKTVRGYKAMNKDMTCRNFAFKVGKTYEVDKLSMCGSGFHFCEKLLDVYGYYPKEANTIICEVEALGEVLKEGDKSCTNRIKIIRRLEDKEILDAVLKNNNSGDGNSGNRNSGYGNSGYGNSGDWNSGYGNSGNRNSGYGNSGYGNSGNRNSGDWNSGDWNSGDWNSGYGNSGYGNSGNRNSGDWNSGDWNSGNGNSGDWNSGDRNSGNRNSGYGNSGYGNSGNRNSGDWNSGDGNSGYFNTEVPIYLFNKPSSIKYTKEFENRIRALNVKPIVEWIPETLMSAEEKNAYPSHKTTGGFLRKTNRHDWKHLTEDDKAFIRALPNFDDEVFQKISGGVSLLSDDVEVVVNGLTKKISKEAAKKLGLI